MAEHVRGRFDQMLEKRVRADSSYYFHCLLERTGDCV